LCFVFICFFITFSSPQCVHNFLSPFMNLWMNSSFLRLSVWTVGCQIELLWSFYKF
jgi:hypothetical protein